METRPFGQTGASLPILSFGAQRIVDEEGCSQEQAIEWKPQDEPSGFGIWS